MQVNLLILKKLCEALNLENGALSKGNGPVRAVNVQHRFRKQLIAVVGMSYSVHALRYGNPNGKLRWPASTGLDHTHP